MIGSSSSKSPQPISSNRIQIYSKKYTNFQQNVPNIEKIDSSLLDKSKKHDNGIKVINSNNVQTTSRQCIINNTGIINLQQMKIRQRNSTSVRKENENVHKYRQTKCFGNKKEAINFKDDHQHGKSINDLQCTIAHSDVIAGSQHQFEDFNKMMQFMKEQINIVKKQYQTKTLFIIKQNTEKIQQLQNIINHNAIQVNQLRNIIEQMQRKIQIIQKNSINKVVHIKVPSNLINNKQQISNNNLMNIGSKQQIKLKINDLQNKVRIHTHEFQKWKNIFPRCIGQLQHGLLKLFASRLSMLRIKLEQFISKKIIQFQNLTILIKKKNQEQIQIQNKYELSMQSLQKQFIDVKQEHQKFIKKEFQYDNYKIKKIQEKIENIEIQILNIEKKSKQKIVLKSHDRVDDKLIMSNKKSSNKTVNINETCSKFHNNKGQIPCSYNFEDYQNDHGSYLKQDDDDDDEFFYPIKQFQMQNQQSCKFYQPSSSSSLCDSKGRMENYQYGLINSKVDVETKHTQDFKKYEKVGNQYIPSKQSYLSNWGEYEQFSEQQEDQSIQANTIIQRSNQNQLKLERMVQECGLKKPVTVHYQLGIIKLGTNSLLIDDQDVKILQKKNFIRLAQWN